MATVIDPPALDAALYSLRGPVMRACFEHAEVIRHVAAQNINRSDGPGPHLSESSLVEDTTIAGRPGFLVVFESEHAGYYYEGTRPHIIRATNARALVFRWPKVGPGLFRFKSVHHPGTKPHPFLHEAVAEIYGVHLS